MNERQEPIKGRYYKLSELEKLGFKRQRRINPWPAGTKAYSKQEKNPENWYDIITLMIGNKCYDGSHQIIEKNFLTSSKPIKNEHKPS